MQLRLSLERCRVLAAREAVDRKLRLAGRGPIHGVARRALVLDGLVEDRADDLCCDEWNIRHLTNFRRSVLGCIDASDSESRAIFQHFFEIY